MKRLDQGHLHPKLEVPGQSPDMSWPGIEHGPPRWRHSKSLLIAIWHLHMSARTVEIAWLPPHPPCMLHELHQDVGWIALARHQQSICQLPRHQHLHVSGFTVKQGRSCGGHRKNVLTSTELLFPKKLKINLSSEQITGRARKGRKNKYTMHIVAAYSGYRTIIMAQVYLWYIYEKNVNKSVNCRYIYVPYHFQFISSFRSLHLIHLLLSSCNTINNMNIINAN